MRVWMFVLYIIGSFCFMNNWYSAGSFSFLLGSILGLIVEVTS